MDAVASVASVEYQTCMQPNQVNPHIIGSDPGTTWPFPNYGFGLGNGLGSTQNPVRKAHQNN